MISGIVAATRRSATEENFSTSERSFSTFIQIVTPPTAALSVVATADAMQVSNCEIIPLLYGSSGTQLAADGSVVDVSPFPPDLIGTIDPNTATFLRPLTVGSAVQDVLAEPPAIVAERRAEGAVWLTEEDEEVFVIEAVIDHGFPFIMRDGFNFAMNPGYASDIPLLPEGLQNLTAYCSAVYDDTLRVIYAEFPECSLPAD